MLMVAKSLAMEDDHWRVSKPYALNGKEYIAFPRPTIANKIGDSTRMRTT